jgi:hypothetical protein
MANPEWTLPVNTIMLLMTMSGTTSTISHGGGLNHKSLSDQVIGLEYVDARGDVQVVEDPEHLKAAAGSAYQGSMWQYKLLYFRETKCYDHFSA